VLEFVVSPELSRERLDKALAELLPETSRATIQRWIEDGRVTVDGGACRARDRLREGSRLVVEPGPAPATAAAPDPSVAFTVLFEDPHLIVVDKPAGLVVHPAKGHDTGTLVNGLLARYDGTWASGESTDPIEAVRPGIVHRIDKDTSGVLVVARSDVAREGLKAQLQAHTMGRRYLALTMGVPTKRTVKTLYGRHPHARLKWSSLVPEGKEAVSHFRVLEVFGEAKARSSYKERSNSVGTAQSGLAALVECRLETGRTHQIRVHMAEQCKTPLLADSLYGRPCIDARLVAVEAVIGRQALHAESLSFEHPVTHEPLTFSSPLPQDFAAALEQLRALNAPR
jgi:23S rRNA pseudouridine1911/1915/1917 synthase